MERLVASAHLNDGNIYAETVPATATGQLLLDFLACRYTHSSREAWSAPTATRQRCSRAATATANPLRLLLHHRCRCLTLQVSTWRGRPHLP